MSSKKVAVVGAGLMGRLMAEKLSLLDYEVHLFDKSDRSGSSSCGMAAAAMLAPISEADKATATVVKLGLASLPLWRQMIDALKDPVYFQQAGSLFVAHPQDLVELQHYQQKISREWSTDYYQLLDQSAIAELEPALADRFHHGIYLPVEGQIANDEWFQAIAKRLVAQGVQWFENSDVTAVTPHALNVKNQTHEFDLVVDCRGLGAKGDITQLRGVRGERFRLYAPNASLNRPVRLMHPRYHIYLVPRPNKQFVLGASEIESDDMSPISVRSTLELLSAAYSVDPAFGEARIIESVVNCRPALPDNEPRIYFQPGLMRINGLYRNGYLVAPAVAENALALLHEQPLTFPEIVSRNCEDK